MSLFSSGQLAECRDVHVEPGECGGSDADGFPCMFSGIVAGVWDPEVSRRSTGWVCPRCLTPNERGDE